MNDGSETELTRADLAIWTYLDEQSKDLFEVQLKWADLLAWSTSRTAAVEAFAIWLESRPDLYSEFAVRVSGPISNMISSKLIEELFYWAQNTNNKLWDNDLLQELQKARISGDHAFVLENFSTISVNWKCMLIRLPKHRDYMYWLTAVTAGDVTNKDVIDEKIALLAAII
jgi:hypothetical protein